MNDLALKIFDIPAELVAELALGMEEPDDVARRYGWEGRRWDNLKAWKPFLDAVDKQRAEFEKTGVTFRLKAAMKADVLADQVFVKAMANETSLLQKIEALRFFSKMGELEPQPKAAVANTGPGFSITIDLGGGSKTTTPVVVDVKPTAVEQVEDVSVVSTSTPTPTPFDPIETQTFGPLKEAAPDTPDPVDDSGVFRIPLFESLKEFEKKSGKGKP